jgi:raffinose/stachyose/melibiose transport system permease protein
MTTATAPATVLATAALPPITARRRRRNRPLTPRRVIRGVLSGIAIAVLLFVEIYPLFWMFINSLKSNFDFLNNPTWHLPQVWQWSNYSAAWEIGSLATTITNSAIATIPSLILIVVLGTAAGFALEVMVWKGRNGVLLLILAGIMIPGQMILLPLFTVYYNIGVTGTLIPLIITYTATGIPLTTFMMATYFRAIPREIFEAATIDGASILRSFISIGFPMIRNAVVTVALVQFFLIWNDLLIAITFADQRPLNTVQAGLLNFSGDYGSKQYGPLLAAVCITVGGILVIYLFLNQRIMRGLTAGSLKG